MRHDKALIKIDHTPLIQRVYQVAQACAGQVYVVTPWVERYCDLLPAECHFIQEISKDALPAGNSSHGPLVGFAQGLAHVQTEWVLLLACDMPRLQIEVLQLAAAQLDQISQEAIALLPRSSQGWEPLCGFYRCCCLPNLTAFIEQGGRSFQRWLSQEFVSELHLSDRQVLFNCNTPDDLADFNINAKN